MINELSIRLATKQDSSKVINMLKGIALWMKENEINQWGYLLDGGDDEEIQQAISNGETHVVRNENNMVATFTLSSKQSDWDKHTWGEDHTSKILYLHRLAIIPSYMNKGLGREILTWIENNAADQEHIRLDCVADNTKLNNFYRDNGFSFVGLTDGHNKYQKSLRKS